PAQHRRNELARLLWYSQCRDHHLPPNQPARAASGGLRSCKGEARMDQIPAPARANAMVQSILFVLLALASLPFIVDRVTAVGHLLERPLRDRYSGDFIAFYAAGILY